MVVLSVMENCKKTFQWQIKTGVKRLQSENYFAFEQQQKKLTSSPKTSVEFLLLLFLTGENMQRSK